MSALTLLSSLYFFMVARKWFFVSSRRACWNVCRVCASKKKKEWKKKLFQDFESSSKKKAANFAFEFCEEFIHPATAKSCRLGKKIYCDLAMEAKVDFRHFFFFFSLSVSFLISSLSSPRVLWFYGLFHSFISSFSETHLTIFDEQQEGKLSHYRQAHKAFRSVRNCLVLFKCETGSRKRKRSFNPSKRDKLNLISQLVDSMW